MLLGAGVVLAMGIYPPWVLVTHNVFPSRVVATETQTEVPAGYSWIWEPPKSDDSNVYRSHSVKLDLSRLLVQWVVAAFAVGAGMLWFKGSEEKSLQDWFAGLGGGAGVARQTKEAPPAPPVVTNQPVAGSSAPARRRLDFKQLAKWAAIIAVFVPVWSWWKFGDCRYLLWSENQQAIFNAEKGQAWAQGKLGWMFNNGQGVPQNYEEAFKWYSKAAEQGDAWAQNNLGVMYHNGQGVQRDYVEAYKWYSLAAALGHKDAAKNRDNLLGSLTPEQVSEGQRRAASAEFVRDFYKKYPDLKPFGAVVDAVSVRLVEGGYKGESREAAMETFARAAREEIKRQQAQPASPR